MMKYFLLSLLLFSQLSCQYKNLNKDFTKENELSAQSVGNLLEKLYEEHQAALLEIKGKAWDDRVLTYQAYKMPFFYKKWGDPPKEGYPLYISLHGGGGGPASMNDGQYRNQQHLYDATMKSMNGIYLAPRAPTNTWNLWHQAHIDILFNDLIQLASLKEKIDLNRVYLLGYSAGGDGVYQLAPRMADRLAAASMMAGHPNNASPMSLRNLPFAIQVGGLDAAYKRNKVAQQWGDQLKALQEKDPKGYIYYLKIHKNKGHWMELEDAPALPWMSKFSRNPIPKKVVWNQGNHLYQQFYWLGVPDSLMKKCDPIIVSYNNTENSINIESNDLKQLYIYLNDNMLNLDKEVIVRYQQKEIFNGKVERKAAHLKATLARTGDPNLSFCARLTVMENEQVVLD